MATRHRPIFYLLVPIVSPLLFLLLVETGLRFAGLGTPSLATDPARGFLPFDNLLTRTGSASGRDLLVVETPPQSLPFMKLRQFHPQSHPVEKEQGEFRILFVGGSLVYGWPYDDRLSFPRLLEVGLRTAAPATKWRVINMGAPGWATTRIRAITPELTKLSADLVVIVSGNNEAIEAEFAEAVFLGRKTRIHVTSWLAQHSHLATLMLSTLPRSKNSAARARADRAPAESPLRDMAIHRERLVRTHHENLAAMARTFEEAGSQVMVATVPVNLRSCRPLGRDGPGDPAGSTDPELIRLFSRASRLVKSERSEAALVPLGELLLAAPRSAQVHYLHAQALDRLGRPREARDAYLRALDLDPVIARAFGAINDSVSRVAQSRDLVLVDLVAAMSRASSRGVPGDDLFIDNCHPNPRGRVVLALEVARHIAAGDLPGPDWEAPFLAGVESYLQELSLSSESRAEALKFQLYYYRVMNPDEAEAQRVQRQLADLDPAQVYAGPEYRASFFRLPLRP